MDLDNKYGTLEMQKALLVLLTKVDAFFIENNIKYSLDSGSLLGAVRHNGFIPWDDDVDIIVDRPTFEKILNMDFSGTDMEHERKLWIDRIRLSTHFLNKIGCKENPTIDLFILDKIPTNRFHQILRDIVIKFMQGMMKPRPDYSRFSFRNKMLSFITYNFGRLFSDTRKYQLYHKFASRYRNNETKFSTCYFYPFNWIGCVFSSDVLQRTTMHQFEDAKFPIMCDYDKFLTEVYGDWRTPPKESERIPIHIK